MGSRLAYSRAGTGAAQLVLPGEAGHSTGSCGEETRTLPGTRLRAGTVFVGHDREVGVNGCRPAKLCAAGHQRGDPSHQRWTGSSGSWSGSLWPAQRLSNLQNDCPRPAEYTLRQPRSSGSKETMRKTEERKLPGSWLDTHTLATHVSVSGARARAAQEVTGRFTTAVQTNVRQRSFL